jgi:hypothetical protein
MPCIMVQDDLSVPRVNVLYYSLCLCVGRAFESSWSLGGVHLHRA